VPAAAEFADFPGRRWFQSVDVLLGAGAAALNQDAQNDNKQNAGNNANQSGGIHCNPLSDSFMSHGQEPVEDSPTCYVEVLRHSHSSSCEHRLRKPIRASGGAESKLQARRQKVRRQRFG
jgi:hypothetical protein